MCVSRSGSSTTTISCRHIEDVSTRGRVIERRLVAGSDFEDMIETAARPGLYVHSLRATKMTPPQNGGGTCVPPRSPGRACNRLRAATCGGGP